MKIPKEIALKVEEYQELNRKIGTLWDEIIEWLSENTDIDESVHIEDVYITDKPTGKKQSDDGEEGEYCEQHESGCGYGDSYFGEYYHQIDGEDRYVGYHFEI